jgi:hypothetical protein
MKECRIKDVAEDSYTLIDMKGKPLKFEYPHKVIASENSQE